MSVQYTRDHVKISVAKILQTLGWQSINTTPLEVLTDILSGYISQLSRITNEYANEFGQTEPNLDHLGLAFREMGVSIGELEEYVTYVNFGPPPSAVPKYPISKENNLNFLKPGSKEVVTRPVYIHEHLPPMFPLLEGTDTETESVIKKEEIEETTGENPQVFKKPADILPVEFKRPRRDEEGSRPTREISSVMMTTSGFLSPAREGKLPESRTPTPAVIEPVAPPVPNVPPEQTEILKKPPKMFNNKKMDRKKEKVGKELFKPLSTENKVIKKTPRKELNKQAKLNKVLANNLGVNALMNNNELKMSPIPKISSSASKINKTLVAARLKTEKLNTTITPITVKPESHSTHHQIPVTPVVPVAVDNVDKLLTEPDKRKMNILKKINSKNDLKLLKKEESKSRGASPNLVIDEPEEVTKIPHLPSDVTIEPINPPMSGVNNHLKSPEKVDCYFDDGSPPGTPSTPKTPEISHSPPLAKEKRKRKDSRKIRKIPKHQSPLHPEVIDLDLERPKTPEAECLVKPEHPLLHPPSLAFPFLANFGGIPPLWPGLIPTPLNNPMFPFSQLGRNFSKNPYLQPPLPHPGLPPMANFMLPKPDEAPKAVPPKPATPPPVPQPAPVQMEPAPSEPSAVVTPPKPEKKLKEHKKEKKDKIKKKNKKDKVKNKAEKKKLKEEKKDKDKIKKEKKEKRKDKEPKDIENPVPKIFLKLGSPSPRPETPETTRKLNIKPIIKKDDEPSSSTSFDERKREPSPGLAKISALVTGPPKQKSSTPVAVVQPQQAYNDNYPTSSSDNLKMKKMFKPIPKIRTKEIMRRESSPVAEVPLPPALPSKYVDKDGNEVWICPGCGDQDDGSPMIGCDGCDAWYHWVCVGIQVPPDENENWYCRHCLSKKNEDLQSDKKKKRRKREKKEH